MLHFTYGRVCDKNLHQGDVLKRTSAVEEILKEVHPHYFRSPDYKYFMVLTQSCDLYRRNGNDPATRYITIAAVRPLQVVFQREAKALLYSDIDRNLKICERQRMQTKLEAFAERLFNNNADDYFYLARDSESGFNQDHCTFLKLSIALKAKIHYETLLRAKILQLNDSFQHKLGYLIGKSYSRVGTEDWLPGNIDKKDWKEKIKDAIELGESINLLDKNVYKYVVSELKKVPEEDHSISLVETLTDQWRDVKVERKKQFVDEICNHLEQVGIEESLVKKVKSRFTSDPAISSLFR